MKAMNHKRNYNRLRTRFLNLKLHVSYGSKIVLMMKSIIKNLKRIAEGGKGVSVPKVIVNIIVENLGDEGARRAC